MERSQCKGCREWGSWSNNGYCYGCYKPILKSEEQNDEIISLLAELIALNKKKWWQR